MAYFQQQKICSDGSWESRAFNSIDNKDKFGDKISRQKSSDVFNKHCMLQPILLSGGLAFDE